MKNEIRNNLQNFEAFLENTDDQTKAETKAELKSHGIKTDEFLKKVQRVVQAGYEKQRNPGAADSRQKIVSMPKPPDENTILFSVAFGRFVELMRRKLGLTVDQLAAKAKIDATEVLSIEQNPQYIPEPSAVYQLGRIFNVSANKLMQLAGLTQKRDAELEGDTIRFAAHSENISRLSTQEREALEQFIAVLSNESNPPKT